MREAEQRTETEYGIPLAELIDNAVKGLARAALEMCPDGVIGIIRGGLGFLLQLPSSFYLRLGTCLQLPGRIHYNGDGSLVLF